MKVTMVAESSCIFLLFFLFSQDSLQSADMSQVGVNLSPLVSQFLFYFTYPGFPFTLHKQHSVPITAEEAQH